jgi:hypothetical protein
MLNVFTGGVAALSHRLIALTPAGVGENVIVAEGHFRTGR